jgi:hypothetical protein
MEKFKNFLAKVSAAENNQNSQGNSALLQVYACTIEKRVGEELARALTYAASGVCAVVSI